MTVDGVQQSANNIAPSCYDVIGPHEVKRNYGQYDSSISWVEEKKHEGMRNEFKLIELGDGDKFWEKLGFKFIFWAGIQYVPMRFGTNRNMFSLLALEVGIFIFFFICLVPLTRNVAQINDDENTELLIFFNMTAYSLRKHDRNVVYVTK